MQGWQNHREEREAEGVYLGKLKVLIPDSGRAQNPKNISRYLFKTKQSQLVYKPSRTHKSTLQGRYYKLLLRDDKIKAHRGYVSCPRWHGWYVVMSEMKPDVSP